jgi:predicted enzyme related to lactoylglutathione lyase
MQFFNIVFGWHFTQLGEEPYWVAFSGDEKTTGINGAVTFSTEHQQPIINSIQVDNMETAFSRITSTGGTVLKDKMAVPGVGWMSYFKDPDGNIHGIWQEDKSVK